MTGLPRLHEIQVSILYRLRHASVARYSEILRYANIEGDVFKFHIGRLTDLGFVQKTKTGLYELSAVGKEFANRLDESTGRETLQPKASMLLVIESRREKSPVYLAHQRLREPFFGYWGFSSGPVPRGVGVKDAAAQEIKKQMSIDVVPQHKGVLRVIDKNPSGAVLEDKFFNVMHAALDREVQPHSWQGGKSEWMTLDELISKSPLFPTTKMTIDVIKDNLAFMEQECIYDERRY